VFQIAHLIRIITSIKKGCEMHHLSIVMTLFLQLILDRVVGTLWTGYPRVQALSQGKKQGVQPHVVVCPTVPHPATLAQEGSGATVCPVAPDPSSLLWGRGAPMSPRVPQLWTLPPCSGGLRRHHTSHSSRPRLPVRRALAPPHVSPLSMGRE
jgi:hypothetical protein